MEENKNQYHKADNSNNDPRNTEHGYKDHGYTDHRLGNDHRNTERDDTNLGNTERGNTLRSNTERGNTLRSNTERNLLTGMFRDRESSENAYNTLQERGYSSDDINLVMSDDTRKKHFSGAVEDTEIGTKAAEGAGKGSAIGGTVGAVAGVIAAIGTSLVIPGLGIVLAGPIAAGLAGAGAGGITGGIIGALVGSGIPEARAKLYESGIKEGQIVIGVHPRNEEDAEYFEENWRTNNAEEIHS